MKITRLFLLSYFALYFFMPSINAQTCQQTLDPFGPTGSVTASVSTPTPPANPAGVVMVNSGIVGGEADVTILRASAGGDVSATWNDFPAGTFAVANCAACTSTTTLTYDGVDGAPFTLNPTGLGGLDMSANTSGFNFDYNIDLLQIVKITIKVYTDATNFSSQTVTYTNEVTGVNFIPKVFPRAGFTAAGGTGVNWSSVGAIVIEFDNTATAGADMRIKELQMPCVVAPCNLLPSPITITSLEYGSGVGNNPQAEDFTFNNGVSTISQNNIAGVHVTASTDGPFFAFCVDITQPLLPIQNPYTHEVNGTANGLTVSQAFRMAQLMQAAGFSSTTGLGITGPSSIPSYVALQMAVWNVIYDTDYSVSTGTFYSVSDNNGAKSIANAWLATAQGITNPTVDVHQLHNGPGQDLIIPRAAPPISVTVTQPTCTSANSPNNGVITIVGFTAGQRYQYSAGTTFNAGSAIPASITAIPAGGVITSSLPNTTASYTVRVYDATDAACFTDRVINITGVNCCLSIGSTAFNDVNNNGIQDAGDAGLSGLTVTLYQADGVTPVVGVSSTTTNANGDYVFNCLPAGTYVVGISAPSATAKSSTPVLPSGATADKTNNGTQAGGVAGTAAKSGQIVLAIGTAPTGETGTGAALSTASDANSYSTVDFGFSPLTTLPVDLIDFKATAGEESIELAWKSAGEKEFSHFELQRSADSKEFVGIAVVNGSKSTFYGYRDIAPIQGRNYYRLKMVDMDGSSKLSRIISFNFEIGQKYLLVQSPASDKSFAVFTNVSEPKMQLFSITGTSVPMTIVNLGNNTHMVNVVKVTSGLYILKMENDGKTFTQKVIVP